MVSVISHIELYMFLEACIDDKKEFICYIVLWANKCIDK